VIDLKYEYLYEKVDKLNEKPFKADEIMKILNGSGIYPIHLQVNNNIGQILVYFDKELDKKEQERLGEIFKKLFKNW